MKIDSITLENFRQYHEKQSLIFSQDPKENVTIIQGVNGAGKTSLFLAINWCLYGEGISNLVELVSKEAISIAKAGDTIQTNVHITFVHDGERFFVSRSLRSTVQLNDVIVVNPSEEFTMMRIKWGSNKTEIIDNPIGRMNIILPSNVRPYFLFDGEKIDNFAKPNARDEVRDAIHNVFKFEILQRGQKHLGEIANEYRREAKKRTPAGSTSLELKEELGKLYEEKEKKIKRKEEVEIEIKAAHSQISTIHQILMRMPDARALQERRVLIEQELAQCERDRDELVREIREIVMDSLGTIAFSAMEKTLAILDGKRSRGEIPSNVRRQFIQDLLDHQQCICGRHFDEGGPEYHRLLMIRDQAHSGTFEDDVLNTIAFLRALTEKNMASKERMDRALKRNAELKERSTALYGQLSDLNVKLKNSPQEDISKLQNKYEDFLNSIGQLTSEQVQIEARLEAINRETPLVRKKRDAAENNEKEGRLLDHRGDAAQKASDAIENVYLYFAEMTRSEIEKKTNEIFKLLISKVNHFRSIKLEDYQLEVFDRYQKTSRSTLSAGERQVLSLAFITAMAQISEEEAPLVMDTPFGRLDETHRDSITDHLPDLASQLVLFVTDTELIGKAQRNLEPYIGKKYYLNFNDETGCTTIEEVK